MRPRDCCGWKELRNVAAYLLRSSYVLATLCTCFERFTLYAALRLRQLYAQKKQAQGCY
jgi:hypothetical protein